MGRFSEWSNRATFAIQDFRDKPRERLSEYGKRVISPRSFEKFRSEDPAVDRPLQILSLLVLPVFIVVSLVIIVVINEVMAEVFGLSNYESISQQGIMGWFITGVTGGLFLLAAWSWFQFVRTCGFGIFRFD